jgi:hypothetical protein
MRNTTTWSPRGHEATIKAVRKISVALANTELSTLLGMGNNGPLLDWKTKTLLPAISELLSAYTAWEPYDERTLKMTIRLEDAETVVVPLCECVAGLALWNPLVTNLQLEMLGLPPRRPSDKPKPAPVMEVAPWYKLVESAIRTVVVEYGDAASGAKRKPAGQQGVECRYLLSKTPFVTSEVTIEMLVHSAFDTKTPIAIGPFTETDRGDHVALALRWENTRGIKGPFGPILFTRIP